MIIDIILQFAVNNKTLAGLKFDKSAKKSTWQSEFH